MDPDQLNRAILAKHSRVSNTVFNRLVVISFLEEAQLAGIYPGNPKRSTATPTTERMLAAFDNINLTIVPVAGQFHFQVTPLTAVQRRILELWGLPATRYTRLSG